MHGASPAHQLSRDRLWILAGLVAVTAIAWLYLVHLGRRMPSSSEYDAMMAAMGMSTRGAWTATDLAFAVAMWVVMMVAMMAGSAVPVLVLVASVHASRGGRGARLAALMFGLGYFAIWVGFSAVAALAQWALQATAMLSPGMAASSRYLAGSILVAAGAYQWTPWKGACLTHCRHPLGFLMTSWRDGPLGAIRMGLQHGAYCLGCCWALMGVLFVVGVMNLIWVAALAVFVLLEKTGRAGEVLGRVAGAAMVAAGVLHLVIVG